MERIIFLIVYQTANILLYVSVFWHIHKKRKYIIPKAFNGVLIYQVVTSLMLIISDLVYFKFVDNLIALNKAQLFFPLFHFFFLSSFVIKSSSESRNKLFTNCVFFATILLLIVITIVDSDKFNYYTITVSNVGLIILVLIYYNNLFYGKKDITLNKSASFFLNTGVFISSGFSLPIYLFGKILESRLSSGTFYFVSILAPVSSIILYLFIIKSISCLNQKITY
jgi:hypothetical protein